MARNKGFWPEIRLRDCCQGTCSGGEKGGHDLYVYNNIVIIGITDVQFANHTHIHIHIYRESQRTGFNDDSNATFFCFYELGGSFHVLCLLLVVISCFQSSLKGA